ncbi:hypothetical protein DFH07DRAFT_945431 [Mycena maculata]|uniref:Uncharacterized protein n=1 Tax=Mycena maculata TaxID=230809 RepID=A0AAD7MS31_9AGAR|nr:hypothetical protein DFH07DRAFT_945431 [Mycena maculata]
MSVPNTLSGPNGASIDQLLSDPNLATCPDYTSESFRVLRERIDADDDEAAITFLIESWTTNNDQEKAQEVEEADAARRQQDADKLAEEARLEEDKKKPKLGDFNLTSAPSTFIEARISPFAQAKIDKMQYCLLYLFGTGGLNDAANALLSSADDASSFRLTRDDGNQLTVQSGLTSNIHKNMVEDKDLSFREFALAWHRYIKEITRANWPKLHVDVLTQFFYGLNTHPLHQQEPEHGDKILRIYADRYRKEWFSTLGTPQSFNLAIINEALLSKLTHEYFTKLHSKMAASNQSAYAPLLIPPTPMFPPAAPRREMAAPSNRYQPYPPAGPSNMRVPKIEDHEEGRVFWNGAAGGPTVCAICLGIHTLVSKCRSQMLWNGSPARCFRGDGGKLTNINGVNICLGMCQRRQTQSQTRRLKRKSYARVDPVWRW